MVQVCLRNVFDRRHIVEISCGNRIINIGAGHSGGVAIIRLKEEVPGSIFASSGKVI